MTEFNFALYILIFCARILENALTTVRIIFVSNGKKLLSSILVFLSTIIYILVISAVLINIRDDIFTILAYALGAAAGSYIGVLIEQKIALGSNMVITITGIQFSDKLINLLRETNYAVTELDGKGKVNDKKILLIALKRKNKKKLYSIIKSIDPDAMVMSENISDISGGYLL